jgi:hypothetical protein
MVKFLNLKKNKSIFNFNIDFMVSKFLREISKIEGNFIVKDTENYVKKNIFAIKEINNESITICIEYFYNYKNIVEIKITEKVYEN